MEAGLRTHDINAPFPEEFNRQVASIIAEIHFAPTPLSKQNLINEKVDGAKICVTGNTVIDSLHWVLNKIESSPSVQSRINSLLDGYLPFLLEEFTIRVGHRT